MLKLDLFGNNTEFSEADIESSLLESLSDYSPQKVEIADIKYDKWLCSSALQKSIRRGLVDSSLLFAELLLKHDRDYIWHRINIIALEDIGLGNINLCNQILWSSGKKSWLTKQDEEKVLLYLVEELAKSVKCRCGDYIPYILEYSQKLSNERNSYGSLKESDYTSLILDYSSINNRLLAAWYLVGTKYIPAENITSKYNNLDLLLDCLKQLELDSEFIWCIEKGVKKTRSFLPLGILGSKLLSQDAQTEIKACTEVKTDFISIYPLPAIDKHTRAGKQANYKFLEQLPEFNQILNNLAAENYIEILGKAIFYLESAKVDRELQHPTLNEIKKDYIISNLSRYGLTESQIGKVLNLVKGRLNILNDVRVNMTKSRLAD